VRCVRCVFGTSSSGFGSCFMLSVARFVLFLFVGLLVCWFVYFVYLFACLFSFGTHLLLFEPARTVSENSENKTLCYYHQSMHQTVFEAEKNVG